MKLPHAELAIVEEAKIVEYPLNPTHRSGAAYEVEFITLTGKTVAVATVLSTQLRPISQRDLSHVRELASF